MPTSFKEYLNRWGNDKNDFIKKRIQHCHEVGYKKRAVVTEVKGMPYVYPSTWAAARAWNVPQSNVVRICQGYRKTTKGLRFWYYEDWIKRL